MDKTVSLMCTRFHELFKIDTFVGFVQAKLYLIINIKLLPNLHYTFFWHSGYIINFNQILKKNILQSNNQEASLKILAKALDK